MKRRMIMLAGFVLFLALTLFFFVPSPQFIPHNSSNPQAEPLGPGPTRTTSPRTSTNGAPAPQTVAFTQESTQREEHIEKTPVGAVMEVVKEDARKAPVMGSLSRTEIDDGIREVMPDILRCYQALIEEVPEMLGGRIDVKFTIADDDGIGRMSRLEIVEAAFDDVPMEECLLDALEEVQFPPPDGGIVIVRYPFFFSTE